MTSPVAGFSTSICPLEAGGAPLDWAVDSDSTDTTCRSAGAPAAFSRFARLRLKRSSGRSRQADSDTSTWPGRAASITRAATFTSTPK